MNGVGVRDKMFVLVLGLLLPSTNVLTLVLDCV